MDEKVGNQRELKEIDIGKVRSAVQVEHYEISRHAERERHNDNLTIADIEAALLSGKIIEAYPGDQRGPSCLVCGVSSTGHPVHVVVGFLETGWVRIVTVYVPDPNEWESDWKTRKRRE